MTRHKAPTRKSALFSLHWCHVPFIQLFTNSLVFLLSKQLVVPTNSSLNFLQHSNPLIFTSIISSHSFFHLILWSHFSVSFIPSSNKSHFIIHSKLSHHHLHTISLLPLSFHPFTHSTFIMENEEQAATIGYVATTAQFAATIGYVATTA